MSRGLRPASPADYPAFVRFFGELETGDPVPSAERWAGGDCARTQFLVENDALVGYAMCEPVGVVALVRHLVVDPRRRGQGLGEELLRRLAIQLRALGCQSWRLNVKIDNQPALRLYRRLGFDVHHRSVALRLGWTMVGRLPRSPRRLLARDVGPADDAALEGQFELVAGQLARMRTQLGPVLLSVHEVEPATAGGGAAVRGLARFDPGFPGAYPFRARSPQAARALLEAMRGFARPGDEHVDLVIEGDESITAALRSAGATVRLELYHMRGLIPVAEASAP
jgi:GNAT superfamily N-acetyltransferase